MIDLIPRRKRIFMFTAISRSVLGGCKVDTNCCFHRGCSRTDHPPLTNVSVKNAGNNFLVPCRKRCIKI
jgi:hypothetical protein